MIDQCCCVITDLTLPVRFEDMEHQNWFGVFMLLTPQHQCGYEQIALHQSCYKDVDYKPEPMDKYVSCLHWLAPACTFFS